MTDEGWHGDGSDVGTVEHELRRARVLLAHAWGLLSEGQARRLLGMDVLGFRAYREETNEALDAQCVLWWTRVRDARKVP